MDVVVRHEKPVRRERTGFSLPFHVKRAYNRFMTSKSVGEYESFDHFHFSAQVVIPHPGTDAKPLLYVSTARHVQNHLVATGPLFCTPLMDAPYPMPGIDIMEYARGMFGTIDTVLAVPSISIAYGTSGRKFKANLCPLPPTIPDPLW